MDIDTMLSLYEKKALELMQKHGLTQKGWTFFYSSSKTRCGVCNYTQKKIGLCKPFILANLFDFAQIMDTIKHEIAHALVTWEDGHGPVWKAKAIELGVTPKAYCDAKHVILPEGKYQATCPNCKKVFHKHRKLKNPHAYICAKCKTRVHYAPVQ
jgi:predicted SprT family Zn-dependent metalloprotease